MKKEKQHMLKISYCMNTTENTLVMRENIVSKYIKRFYSKKLNLLKQSIQAEFSDKITQKSYKS